ncbi:MAG: DNA polymerase III subunit gamma/tau [Bacteroidales bacterium]|nr:DNA polymerase III subunit gamma/tau [Bacteroidales bacterium]
MENFIVSARKYRPATFDSIVGQQTITNTLKNAIKNHHLAQAYLFTGPRGVGKTTAARIFAKTINCLNIDLEKNPDLIEPCNTCESCQSFSQNASFNIMELDAASNNSVDDIRRLVEQVRIPPQVGKYKVYIIDEVHMLSTQAFNAFLKTLEEPPSYVKFILATTEKHKIIPTILSRCQVFDFKRISVEDIAKYLRFVADSEHVQAEDEALHLIALKADGGMRDALSIFDQLVSYTNANVSYQNVVENLHVLDYDYFFQISDLFLSSDITSVLLVLNDIIERGFDGQHFLIGLGEHLRNLLISRDVKTIDLLETSASIKQRYYENANKFSSAFLLKALDINTQCDVNYKTSNNKRLLIELSLMQMVALGSGLLDPVSKESAPGLPLTKKTPKIESVPQKAPAVEMPQVQVNEPVKETPIKEQVANKEPEASTETPLTETKKPEESPTRIQRVPKGMGLGVSIKAEENSKSEEINPDAYMLGKEDIADDFTQEDVDKICDEFLEGIKNQQSLYATLKSNKALILEDAVVQLHVYNEAQRSALSDKLFELVKSLRVKLNNYKIKATIKIIENGKTMKASTPIERYNAMTEKNPNLKKLTDNLNLELEF